MRVKAQNPAQALQVAQNEGENIRFDAVKVLGLDG
jgi:hypothetical protein